ncbi:hypothetical protein FJR45_05165 [Sulfurimonas sediminis]|uniref:Uncharacterized protein n=1 Tax=Sulfurimonas sediminis TaxID=2590020 RepID=A0A7M1B3V7_9BACT|nr:hypothetical protein [Sulfurimonas sediminis]QOP43372.1 hypothetical protein FJR45_05165 [Sulfurimonas sediminis]
MTKILNETCIRMYCESEGRCHGIVFVFFDETQKENILHNVNLLAHRHRVHPDVTVSVREKYGEVFIDFYDEYHHEDQYFFEDLVSVLGAKLCDCEDL